MARSLTAPRIVVISVNAVIVIAMLALFIGTGSYGRANPLLLWMIVLVPMLAIGWSVANIDRRARILGHLGLTMLMIPMPPLGYSVDGACST